MHSLEVSLRARINCRNIRTEQNALLPEPAIPSTGKVISTDKTAVRAELILVSIAQQPSGNPVTLQKLLSADIEQAVPSELIDLIEKHVNSLNRVSPEEEKNS
jgi:hypothetical protein